ncbi:hypothetical protein MSG28_004042 [Choristoneura fumiferana]|uniref:Uncharacterized protein n=1 Tax=Choristoneura fumiferana TaxID=7141 RepID=A0ACC0KHW4_CHOFU|nr:hypothetical protein MSG28_004042 [Choristoneura fumiferana]
MWSFQQQFLTHPQDPAMYEYMGVFMSYCNGMSCNDELAVSLFFIIITKECVFKLISHVHALFFLRTDYNQGRSVNINVPCWEREYTLTPVKDVFVNDKLKGLAIQFGLSIGFICGCPLTLFFIICVNLLDIR